MWIPPIETDLRISRHSTPAAAYLRKSLCLLHNAHTWSGDENFCARPVPMGFSFLDVPDCGGYLPGPGEHLDQRALHRTGVSSFAHSTGVGVQRIRAGVRDLPGSRGTAGGPVWAGARV